MRLRAQQLGIDLSEVRPGEEGRIRHADLDAFISYGAPTGHAPSGATRADETIKVIGLRRRIAENMAAAKRNIPHFTYVEECDVTELERLREQLNGGRGDKPKLTMLPLLIAAICKTIPQFPMINARYDDEANVVTRHGAVHLGMATQTDGGLMVPVIRDAQAKNLWQLAGEIRRRFGTRRLDDLAGLRTARKHHFLTARQGFDAADHREAGRRRRQRGGRLVVEPRGVERRHDTDDERADDCCRNRR